MHMPHLKLTLLIALVALAALFLPLGLAQQQGKPYKVTVTEEKPDIAEGLLPVDPKIRIAYSYGTKSNDVGMNFGVSAEGRPLADCVGTLFLIDGQIRSPQNLKMLRNLPEMIGALKKKRHGGQTAWTYGDVRVTLMVEVVHGKPSQGGPSGAGRRRMDTLLVKYIIENIGEKPHKVGCRAGFHTNAATGFAAPNHPDEILGGVVLDRKSLPDFLETLGSKSVFTLKLSNSMEAPSKVVLTNAGLITRGTWDVEAMPEGRSACALFWEAKDILPESKREIGFGYGQGVACPNEGRVSAEFVGSFEPGKRFSVMAYVDGPIAGQSLTLLLPKGIERIDGKTTQAVPLSEGNHPGVVVWHCRVREAGAHAIRIRSSTGATNTWTVTVAPQD